MQPIDRVDFRLLQTEVVENMALRDDKRVKRRNRECVATALAGKANQSTFTALTVI